MHLKLKQIAFQIALLFISQVLNEVPKGPLIWAEEFNYNGPVNSSVWNVIVKGDNYNNEIQYYTNSTSNVNVTNGYLIITTKNEKYGNRNYTSGRIESKLQFTYGVFEMKAKLPFQGRGVWPAFWLFAYNLKWPTQYGEIDIMENVGWRLGKITATTFCTLNGSYNQQTNSIDNIIYKSGTIQINDTDISFHIYTVDWNKDRLIFYADDIEYYRFYKKGYENAWTFDKLFTLIVNNAVGGNWGGVKGIDNSIFPTYFIVDYIRQYQSLGDITSSTNKITTTNKITYSSTTPNKITTTKITSPTTYSTSRKSF